METRDKLFTEEQYRKQLAGYSKRCKQLESSIMEIINAEKEHIQLYSAPNSNVAYNKTYIVYGMHSLMPIIGNTIVVNVRH